MVMGGEKEGWEEIHCVGGFIKPTNHMICERFSKSWECSPRKLNKMQNPNEQDCVQLLYYNFNHGIHVAS
jgi:hypothetical protein